MSERGEVKRDKAKAVKNSGRGWREKGDARWYDFVVDYKESKKGFTLNRDNWGKICTDTMKTDWSKSPALKLIVGENPGIIRLAVIEWSKLQEMVEELDRLRSMSEDKNDLY